MKVEPLHPDVVMFVGDEYESVSTAFFDGDDALLVDALAGEEDARQLREVLCGQLGKNVRAVVSTHRMSDHMAGLTLFPQALSIAQRHHRHTFLSQNRRVDAYYREPKLVFDGTLSLRWGRHELHLLHNPGKTLDHVSVDAPGADLVCVGDNIVGRIVYLSKADPAQLRGAIDRIKQLGRGTVIGGHMGRFPAAVLDQALHYLDRLRETVVRIRSQAPPALSERRIRAIAIEDCVAAGVEPTPFEREWHGHNLDVVVGQSVFALDAALAAREARA
ncbi:MBL fold metallo-hydrolase [Lysobacter firmicutimachus]|uniref:MBL fold metallo-hydrolase n=1 Tax=Lysobacter firmicutimachus TaxID=1792846 RepID=A0AAU8MX32_9GAMM